MDTDLDVACHLNVLLDDATGDRLPAALDVIARAGFARVVLPPLDPATADASALRRALQAAGLSPITIAVQRPDADVSSTDAAIRRAGSALLARSVDLTHEIGGDQMNGVPYGPFGRAQTPPTPAQRSWAADGVGRAADYAQTAGLTMTFEVLNRYETAMVNTAAQAIEFIALSGSAHLRIHLDTFHMAIEEPDARAAIRAALPLLGYLELGAPGRGALEPAATDIAGLVGHALDDGYTGRWGIEAFSRPVVGDALGDALAVWSSTYADSGDLLQGARKVIHRGWAQSVAGRRARRLSRRDDTAKPARRAVR